jgi:phosphonatase-like hydrolase
MNIQLVVFDIAGTTVMDRGNINEAFRTAFSNAGFKADAADVDKAMGYRKIDAIKMLLDKSNHLHGNADLHVMESIHADFTKNLTQFYEHDVDLKPMPFAEDTFEQLQNSGIKVALNTGFTKEITGTILSRLNWNKSHLINYVISSDEVPEGRPYPYMINKLMEQSGIKEAYKVAKVGDTKADIQEGRNAACGLVIAVTTGAFTREQLLEFNSDHIIDSLRQLPALIQ